MSKPSKKERRNFRRTAASTKGSNLAKRYQPRGGLRR